MLSKERKTGKIFNINYQEKEIRMEISLKKNKTTTTTKEKKPNRLK